LLHADIAKQAKAVPQVFGDEPSFFWQVMGEKDEGI
jgi:hypothetical protein